MCVNSGKEASFMSRSIDIDQAVNRACEEPTLLDALFWICVWESDRAVRQVRENYGSGINGAGWDTYFKHCLKQVMESYNKPKEKKQKLEMEKEKVEVSFRSWTVEEKAELIILLKKLFQEANI